MRLDNQLWTQPSPLGVRGPRNLSGLLTTPDESAELLYLPLENEWADAEIPPFSSPTIASRRFPIQGLGEIGLAQKRGPECVIAGITDDMADARAQLADIDVEGMVERLTPARAACVAWAKESAGKTCAVLSTTQTDEPTLAEFSIAWNDHKGEARLPASLEDRELSGMEAIIILTLRYLIDHGYVGVVAKIPDPQLRAVLVDGLGLFEPLSETAKRHKIAT